MKYHGKRNYISILGLEVNEPLSNNGSIVGLDLGVTKLVTLSDGSVIENPKALASSQNKIKRLQRILARKQKGSANRYKVRKKLACAFKRVSNLRKDILHKATTTLTKKHSQIMIEDLKVKEMTKSGRGKRKTNLNRVILDASFGEFRRQLEYKSKLYGCEITLVKPHYTSQRCSFCGYIEKANRKSQSKFKCLSCNFEANADENAAINILVAGSCPETQNACGAGLLPANQESVLL